MKHCIGTPGHPCGNKIPGVSSRKRCPECARRYNAESRTRFPRRTDHAGNYGTAHAARTEHTGRTCKNPQCRRPIVWKYNKDGIPIGPHNYYTCGRFPCTQWWNRKGGAVAEEFHDFSPAMEFFPLMHFYPGTYPAEFRHSHHRAHT